MKVLMIAMVSLLLFGCGNYEELKADLQTEYDRINPGGNRAFCYYVGDVKFPYIETALMAEDTYYVALNKDRLAIRLPLFTDLGLLKKEIVNTEPLLYSYVLTEQGNSYQDTYDRHNDSGRVKHENYFCFGRRVLQEITNVEDSTHQLYSWGGKYTRTTISYNYLIENLPEWAKSGELYKVYEQIPTLFDGSLFPGSAYLKKENNGYYNDGGVKNQVFRYY